MKFTISSHALLESVKCVTKACVDNATNLMFTGVKIDACDGTLTMVATNGTESVRRVNQAMTEEDGSAVMSGKTLMSVARSLPDAAVTFEGDGNVVKISCMKAKYRLNTLDVMDFPEFPDIDESQSVTIPASVMTAMTDKTCRCASKDASRPVLGGVKVTVGDGRIVMSATDSYRLVTVDAAADGEFEAIIPADALRDAVGMAQDEVTIACDERQVRMSSGGTTYITRVISGNFPDVTKFIPSGHETTLTFEPQDFADALKRVEAMAKDNPSVRVSMSAEEMFVQLQSMSPTQGESTDVFAGTVEGKDQVIALNINFLKDAIAGCDGETSMELMGSMQPAIFRHYGDMNYVALLMPVRL